MKKLLTTIALLLIAVATFAQKQVTLTVQNKLGSNLFGFNQTSTNDLNQDFQITRLEYYMSGFTIVHDGGMETSVPITKYILVNASTNVVEDLGTYNITNLEGIKFHIGVNEPTNTSDPSVYNPPHPLAAQWPSMHWGWASGYRFVALEGKAGANFTTNFQMHGLGNANYFETKVSTSGYTNGNKLFINLDADYTKALKTINVNTGPIDHGTNLTDLKVLQNFRDHVFTAGAGFAAGVEQIVEEVFEIYPNPSNGTFNVVLKNEQANFVSAKVYDAMGKLINNHSLIDKTNTVLTLTAAGVYWVEMIDKSGLVYTKKLVVY